jgi:hypothetical protein
MFTGLDAQIKGSDALAVNKFGYAPNGIQSGQTDIWDRSDASVTQSTWIAPTTARYHTLTSTDNSDTMECTLYGLPSWDSKEISESVTLTGTAAVTTSTAYVIIHRAIANGNAGTIAVTAGTDNTVTAQINIGEGQTQMAIYGIPSIQNAYMNGYYASMMQASAVPADVVFRLKINPNPNIQLVNFLTKHTQGIQSTGKSQFFHEWKPLFKIEGPAIIKMTGSGSANDIDGSAGFDLFLIDS